MQNLFIITTPFQLLSSYEAIHKFKLKNNILVIIENSNLNNKKQLTNLIKHNMFEEIIQFGYKKKSKLFKSINLIKKLKKFNYDNLFIGDLGSIHKIFASNISSKKIYLLDDGTATIIRYEQLKNRDLIFKKSLRQLRYNLLGIKTYTNKQIDIFTMFKNLISTNYCNIIHHDFEYLKEQYDLNKKTISEEIYILGETFVEDNITKKEHYLNFIENILMKYPNYKIHYLLHKNENIDKLKKFNKKIKIVESKMPGEQYFLELNKTPKLIISSFTTLLFSLKNIFPNVEIISYRLENNKRYDEIFKLLEKNQIKIILDQTRNTNE